MTVFDNVFLPYDSVTLPGDLADQTSSLFLQSLVWQSSLAEALKYTFTDGTRLLASMLLSLSMDPISSSLHIFYRKKHGLNE